LFGDSATNCALTAVAGCATFKQASSRTTMRDGLLYLPVASHDDASCREEEQPALYGCGRVVKTDRTAATAEESRRHVGQRKQIPWLVSNTTSGMGRTVFIWTPRGCTNERKAKSLFFNEPLLTSFVLLSSRQPRVSLDLVPNTCRLLLCISSTFNDVVSK
jgi:hypothetical protein